jgi:hypothetical protein
MFLEVAFDINILFLSLQVLLLCTSLVLASIIKLWFESFELVGAVGNF